VRLDDPAALARVDPHGARDVLAAFPAQCAAATRLRLDPPVALARPRAVVVAGVGGSASAGDLLAACAADRLGVPVLVHRGYDVPALVGPQDLVIAISYSGDTAETLAAAAAARARGARVVAVTAGGRLGAQAAAEGWPRVTLPAALMPRMALGYLFFALAEVLARAGLPVVDAGDVDEALALLEVLARDLGPATPASRNEAKRLALEIGDRVPVVYGGPSTAPLAYRWKTDFEENAKVFAVAGALPEMNHNEIEAWRGPRARHLHLLLLRDRAEPAEIARRFALLRELVGAAAGGVSETWARGAGGLARRLGLAYLGQWTSYYLAILGATDPWAVPTLETLKRRLAAPGGDAAGAAP